MEDTLKITTFVREAKERTESDIMREILFRGKRVDNGEWVYGVPAKDQQGETVIVESLFECDEYNCRGANCFYVDDATVGQYTGLTANGKKIFEGDVIIDNYFKLLPNKPHVATFYETYRYGVIENLEFEVIGNIHDNPELLKGE